MDRDQTRKPLRRQPLTQAQRDQLEMILDEAVELPYAVVRLEFKNGKPRHVYLEKSQEFVRT